MIFGLLFAATSASAVPLNATGVTFSGADFGTQIPGENGVDFIFPTEPQVVYFKSKGMNIFRLSVMWERVQNTLGGDFNAEYTRLIDGYVQIIQRQNTRVVIDIHNGARYRGNIIGAEGSPVTQAHFADLWTKLATRYMSFNFVIFGLMSEPNTMSTELWLANANVAIAAIRATGARNLITVPGNAWTGAHSWMDNWYGTPNGQVMQNIRDPLNNFIIEVHQYMNEDYSGSAPNCDGPIGSARVSRFTEWARQNKFQAYLGQFNAGFSNNCADSINDLLTYLENNRDVWWGWSWWSAGTWWGEHWVSIEPKGADDDLRLPWLTAHMSTTQ